MQNLCQNCNSRIENNELMMTEKNESVTNSANKIITKHETPMTKNNNNLIQIP